MRLLRSLRIPHDWSAGAGRSIIFETVIHEKARLGSVLQNYLVNFRHAGLAQWRGCLILLLGFSICAGQTAWKCYNQIWSQPEGQLSGILVMVATATLIYQLLQHQLILSSTESRVIWFCAAFAALSYVVGSILGILLLECCGLLGLLIVGVWQAIGLGRLATLWFPLAALACTIPMPSVVASFIVEVLQRITLVSVTAGLQAAGFNVARSGVNILIDNYDIAIVNACSGITALEAIAALSLMYVYWRRKIAPVQIALLAIPIIFLAIVGNIIRVSILVLVTAFAGEAAAQSYLHELAGAVVFIFALGGVVVIDQIIARNGRVAKPTP